MSSEHPQITSINSTAEELQLTWSDGKESRLAAIWLRDHCQMPGSRNPDNGQRLINITDIPTDTRIKTAQLNQGNVVIEFSPENYSSTYPAFWLRENCYHINETFDNRSESRKTLWQKSDLENAYPQVDYADDLSSRAAKKSAFTAVASYGFVVLHKVPTIEGTILDVIKTFGYVRETNYGPLFEVRTEIDPTNLAFTNLGLGCHLDNPYRDPVPGLQLLHCLESSTEGGETILQDGFQAAAILRQENPEHFRLLHENWINFRFRDGATDLRSRVPLIEINADGEIIKVRFNNRSIDTIKLKPALIKSFYEAYRHFAEILERPDQQIEFKLEVGDLLLFDNTRVLHARKAFAATGKRHLQGAYSDLDGLYSSLAKLD